MVDTGKAFGLMQLDFASRHILLFQYRGLEDGGSRYH